LAFTSRFVNITLVLGGVDDEDIVKPRASECLAIRMSLGAYRVNKNFRIAT
jgi:hypothetical protein